METLRTAALLACVLLLASGAARAGDDDWDDMFEPYTQRLDTGTTSSGNAQNVNAATQMINPWPPYVRDRRIPGNGARMVGAVERYRNPLPPAGSMGGSPKPGVSAADNGSGSPGGTGGTAPSDKSGQAKSE